MLLPENVSTLGLQIDRIFWAIVLITGFFFFLVQGCLLFFILRFRARPGHKKASYIHGNNTLEIVWTVIPALILLVLTVTSQKVWAQIRPAELPPAGTQIEITAEQFAWNVRYPGKDGQLQTEDDIETLNQLHFPVNEPVNITLKSKDVIHSFFVPQFRVKQDAVPGLSPTIQLNITKPGEYEILCAELCGLGHYRMRGFVTTESRPQFEAWLKETKENE